MFVYCTKLYSAHIKVQNVSMGLHGLGVLVGAHFHCYGCCTVYMTVCEPLSLCLAIPLCLLCSYFFSSDSNTDTLTGSCSNLPSVSNATPTNAPPEVHAHSPYNHHPARAQEWAEGSMNGRHTALPAVFTHSKHTSIFRRGREKEAAFSDQ